MIFRKKLLSVVFFSICLCLVVTPGTSANIPLTIVCWGSNFYGQASPPVGNNYVAIAAGVYHNLALRSDGSIVGWGDNTNGQASPPAGNDYVAISAGYKHSIALRSDGTIVGWGDNTNGQASPPAGNDYVAISAGNFFNLALRADGTIVGWGDNYYGQASPPAGNNFVAIATGGSHSLALRSDGSIVGWGWNSDAQTTPPAGNNYIAIAAGGSHSLALRNDGSIIAWGRNTYGQASPPAGNNYIAIAAGGSHSLALRNDGSIVGWGYNANGQVSPPVGNDFVAISAGSLHSIAIQTPFWSSLGGHTSSSVAIDVEPNTGRWFAVIRGTDNHLYAQVQDWGGWAPIGGTTNDEPTLAFTRNYFHIVIRGTDNALYYKKCDLNSGVWDPAWTPLGGHTLSAPTLISTSGGYFGSDRVTLAIRGTDNHVYLKDSPYGGLWSSDWSSWAGGTTNDRPMTAFTAHTTSDPYDHFTIAVRGVDNKVYTKTQNSICTSNGVEEICSSGWTSWTSPGGSTLSPPVVFYKGGLLHIVVRGTDNHIYLKAGSNPYISAGGTTSDTPAAYSWHDQPLIEVSIRGTDSKVYDKKLNTNTHQWTTGWTNMRGSTASHPTFSQGMGSNGVLGIRGTDNGVYIHFF